MKLKTLNELMIGDKKLTVQLLRQEAIKWINNGCVVEMTRETEDWIKHFFNITEDDLK